MSQITDDPALRAQALPGETIWEGRTDAEVIFQRVCPDCDKGLLTHPARFCGRCDGSGYLTRTEPRSSRVPGEGS